jgi:hypothetical protein
MEMKGVSNNIIVDPSLAKIWSSNLGCGWSLNNYEK